MRYLYFFTFLFFSIYLFSSNTSYEKYFDKAYQQNPAIPKGLLESVAHHQTRINHITHSPNEEGSCIGLPKVYGVMGLTLDGKNYFKNNLITISQLSGYTVSDIKDNPEKNILAYAKALSLKAQNTHLTSNNPLDWADLIVSLSEFPQNNLQQDFAVQSFLYEVFKFLNNKEFQNKYHFPDYQLDLKQFFGENNFEILSSSLVKVYENKISANGLIYNPSSNLKPACLDYPAAIWDPADPSNYSSRSGTPVSAITIHDIEGSYAGAISWFKNPAANVSAHYVLRSSDGQVTQMVCESDKAWHVGSENPYTIGFEHEGYANQQGWYTTAMYQSSANIAKDICNDYGISRLRTMYFPWSSTTNYNTSGIPGSCVKIKGHQHYPNQTHTDPGQYWDWDYFYKLINDNTTVTTLTSSSGTITDSGGSTANYSDDERQLILIQPTNAATITLQTVQFDLENTWDYLYIYDGNSVFDPKIGEYTGTTIPSTITSTGGSLLIEFRSDCATNNPGFEFNYTSTTPDIIPPTNTIDSIIPYVSNDFIATFHDSDNVGGSGLEYTFYQVIDFDGTEWRANADSGFFSDNFDIAIHPDWTIYTGTWTINNSVLEQSDTNLSNTNIAAYLNQNISNQFLYHWAWKISGTNTNKRAGFHFMCDSVSKPNRGNSYFVWFREDDDKLQIYSVNNDVFSLEKDVSYSFNPNQWYDFKVIYDKLNGNIDVYINNVFVDSWTDPTPLTTGNGVSFRSGNAVYSINNFKVYKHHDNQELVSVGPTSDNEIRYQNPTPTQAAGKIKSISTDVAHNISSIFQRFVHVDFTSSIEETISTNVKIYPIPFNQIINLNADKEIKDVYLFDVNGKLVKFINNINQFKIDFYPPSNLSNGNYILTIIYSNTEKQSFNIQKVNP